MIEKGEVGVGLPVGLDDGFGICGDDIGSMVDSFYEMPANENEDEYDGHFDKDDNTIDDGGFLHPPDQEQRKTGQNEEGGQVDNAVVHNPCRVECVLDGGVAPFVRELILK